MAENLIPWIRLTRSGASARRLNALLTTFGDPEAILSASPSHLAHASGMLLAAAERFLAATQGPCDADLRLIEKMQVRLIRRADADYPPLLEQIYDPPPVFYLRGQLPDPTRRVVAIVGSRRASSYGLRVAQRLAQELTAAGVAVVSGLARGLDTAAHRGALTGGGVTVAVLACGLDVPYPYGSWKLAQEIAVHGALISEYPMGSPPEAWHFPTRNRIISGLSHGVLVVEAGLGSGALITANCAVDQNRDVYAVPGSIDNPFNRGAHALIKDGAKLVECVDDILNELGMGTAAAQPALPLEPLDLTETERRLLALLNHEPKPLDDLILESGLPAAEVNATLLMLEVKGAARRHPGNAFARE